MAKSNHETPFIYIIKSVSPFSFLTPGPSGSIPDTSPGPTGHHHLAPKKIITPLHARHYDPWTANRILDSLLKIKIKNFPILLLSTPQYRRSRDWRKSCGIVFGNWRWKETYYITKKTLFGTWKWLAVCAGEVVNGGIGGRLYLPIDLNNFPFLISPNPQGHVRVLTKVTKIRQKSPQGCIVTRYTPSHHFTTSPLHHFTTWLSSHTTRQNVTTI